MDERLFLLAMHVVTQSHTSNLLPGEIVKQIEPLLLFGLGENTSSAIAVILLRQMAESRRDASQDLKRPDVAAA